MIGDTTSKFQAYSSAMAGMARDGVVLMGTGYQIANAAVAPVKATFATKDALAELGSLGIEKLGLLEDAAASFSTTWAGTTKPEFLTAAYDIKSGIESLSDEGVAGYTALAGVTAKATKSSIAEMTSLFATGYSIYKDYYGDLSDLEFGEIFSGGISQSVKQFKTTGSGMAQAISALGGSATSAKVPLEEQLTILGMLQATMSGSEAGTKYTAFLQTAARAGKELGLNFLDAAGLFAANARQGFSASRGIGIAVCERQELLVRIGAHRVTDARHFRHPTGNDIASRQARARRIPRGRGRRPLPHVPHPDKIVRFFNSGHRFTIC